MPSGWSGRLDGGMEMEADGEAAPGRAGQRILAAQIVAVGGEEELARVAQAEGAAIAVMRRRDPEIAAILGALMRRRSRRRSPIVPSAPISTLLVSATISVEWAAVARSARSAIPRPARDRRRN